MITLSNIDFSVALFAAWILGMVVSSLIEALVELTFERKKIKRAEKITQESNEAVARMQAIHTANVEMQTMLKEGE